MDKKITKIVLTGGPCGGKSTGLSCIEKEMSKLGYKVVIINESATELTLNGLSYPAYNNDGYLFEIPIVKLQILNSFDSSVRFNYHNRHKFDTRSAFAVCSVNRRAAKPICRPLTARPPLSLSRSVHNI